jgi:hypothetical protein
VGSIGFAANSARTFAPTAHRYRCNARYQLRF